MSITVRLSMCMAIRCFLVCGVFAQTTSFISHTIVGQPQTLSDAENQYQKNSNITIKSDVNAYAQMARYFYNQGWYDRTIELCDYISSKWMGDKEAIVRVQLTKAKALAGLNDFDTADIVINKLYKRYEADNSDHNGIPFKIHVSYLITVTRVQMFALAKKYQEAADSMASQINILQSAAGANIFKGISADSMKVKIVEDYLRTEAYYNCLASNFEKAKKQYDEIIKFIEQTNYSLPSDMTLDDSQYFALLNYIIYAEKADCLMHAGQYTEALMELMKLEQKSKDITFQMKTFLVINTTDSKKELVFNNSIAQFATRIDLQIRIAKCCYRLSKREQAIDALNEANKALNDTILMGNCLTIYNKDPHDIIIGDEAISPTSISILNTKVLPSLTKDIISMKE